MISTTFLLFKIRFNTTRLYSNALMAEQTQKNWKGARDGNHQIFMIKNYVISYQGLKYKSPK